MVSKCNCGRYTDMGSVCANCAKTIYSSRSMEPLDNIDIEELIEYEDEEDDLEINLESHLQS